MGFFLLLSFVNFMHFVDEVFVEIWNCLRRSRVFQISKYESPQNPKWTNKRRTFCFFSVMKRKEENRNTGFLPPQEWHFLIRPPTKTRTILFDINMRESFVLYSFFDDLFEFLEFFGVSLTGESTSRMFCESIGIKWTDDIAFWSCLRDGTYWSRRRRLARCEGIVLIIEHDIGDIKIPATRMDKVPHTNPIAITITTNNDNGQWRICEFDSCCKWYCTTMKRLCRISVDILGCLSRTTNSRNHHSFMRWDSEFFEGIFDRHDDEEVPATGTPLDVCESRAHSRLFGYRLLVKLYLTRRDI